MSMVDWEEIFSDLSTLIYNHQDTIITENQTLMRHHVSSFCCFSTKVGGEANNIEREGHWHADKNLQY